MKKKIKREVGVGGCYLLAYFWGLEYFQRGLNNFRGGWEIFGGIKTLSGGEGWEIFGGGWGWKIFRGFEKFSGGGVENFFGEEG